MVTLPQFYIQPGMFVRLFTLSLLLLFAGGARAATITVTRGDDRNATCDPGVDCSLREAVALANSQAGDDTILFNVSVPATITLTNGEIAVTSNVIIKGPGVPNYAFADDLVISGNGASRIFAISGATNVTISGLTLTGGTGIGASPAVQGGGAIRAGGSLLTLDTVRVVNNPAGSTVGGGVYVPTGSLTVINSTFTGNTAQAGGAIYHDGTTLKVQGSTFNGNQATSADDNGGGGAIYSDDPTVISNSTFSGNSTAFYGGGVYFIGTSIETLVVRNSTFTGNSAGDFAGGIGNFGDGGGTVANTILSLNTAGSLPDYYDGGSINEVNNYTGNSPALGPLADNGGPTQTHALLAGSPAINAGSNSQALDINGAALTTDQRGPGFPRVLSGVVDIGAFEGVVVGNNPPSITPAGPLSRQQGSPGGAAVQIATVSDAETDDGSLTVTVVPGGTVTGVSVTSIINNSGNIMAVVEASCTATSGTVRLQVSDGTNNVTGDLTVNVSPNDAPTLSYTDPQFVTVGGSLTVFPASGPSDNGSVASVVLQDVSPNTFTGTISVDNSDGSVTVTNAGPAGDYVVTVRATDNCGETTDATFTLRVSSSPSAGQVLISEFRFNGPNGDGDEFYELYNNTDADIMVSTGDGSGGWSLAVHDPATSGVNIIAVIPSGTLIPARGHYLITDTGLACPCYSLDAYAAGDAATFNTAPASAGVALFTTANTANFGAANRLDAAATGLEFDPLFKEGTTLPAVSSTAEYSFVRKLSFYSVGRPQDTNDNGADFALVTTDTTTLSGATLGAPGPENLASPLNRNTSFSSALTAPGTAQSESPNRTRTFDIEPCADLGSLLIRRTFTNNGGAPVTGLRFRVIDITTVNSPGYSPSGSQATLHVRDSQDESLSVPGRGSVQVRGLTLEQPPSQPAPQCGGLNSSLSDDEVTLESPLAPGESIDVVFRLGIEKGGSFRFYVNVEALTDSAAPAKATSPGPVNVPARPSDSWRKVPALTTGTP